MRKFTLLFCFLIVSLRAWAHLGGISGAVYDRATRLPLKDVTVQVSGTGKAAITNELGQYRFEDLVPARYKVEFSHVSFRMQVVEVNVVSDEMAFLKVELAGANVELSEVTISSRRAHDQQLISSLDIRLRPITNSQEILRIVRGLFIGQHAGGGKAEQIFLRGFDIDHGTDIRLTLDGIPVNLVSHAHGQGYADLHFVIPELVNGVDFKKGPYTTDKGNFSTAGWADFRTKDALDKSFVKLEAGQFDTYRAAAGIDLLGQKGRRKISRRTLHRNIHLLTLILIIRSISTG